MISEISYLDTKILSQFHIQDRVNLNEKLFENIDTSYKAYLLGYIAAQFKCTINFNENSLAFYSDNLYNVMNLKNIINFYIQIYNFNEKIYYFKIQSNKMIEDICYHIYKDSLIVFPNFKEDVLKINFIRGFFDKNGGISISDDSMECYVVDTDENEFKNKICTYLDIKYTVNDNNLILFKDVNLIDFLGKIYDHNDKLRNKKFYEAFIKAINNDKITVPYCKVHKNDPNAILPLKVRESDTGYDLTIIKRVKDFNNTTSLYDTGISITIQPGYYAEIVPRSSLSKSGFMLANSIGIIDCSYRGNLFIALSKIDLESHDITLPFRCCQLIFRKQIFMNMMVEDKTKTTDTNRSDGGFGSTSK